MIKRIVFGFIWFAVIYLGACVAIGAVAGGRAGAGKSPEEAAAAGARAGAEAVQSLRPYLLGGSILLAAMGAWTQTLPGTRSKARPEVPVA